MLKDFVNSSPLEGQFVRKSLYLCSILIRLNFNEILRKLKLMYIELKFPNYLVMVSKKKFTVQNF